MVLFSRTVCMVLVLACLVSCAGKNENPYGPWDAFTYSRKENTIVRQNEGQYETLNKCMNWVTMRTKHTGASYYCGYRCETKKGNVIRCEKLMGYPI